MVLTTIRLSAFRAVNLSISTRTMSTDKIMEVFEAYRKTNYAQSLPSRMAKDLVAAADADSDGSLSKDEISAVLSNIGAGDTLGAEEIDAWIKEVAGDDGHLQNDEFIRLLSGQK